MIQWIGTIFLLTSVFLIGNSDKKSRTCGFICGILGCICWVLFGITLKENAIIAMNIFFLILNFRGFLNSIGKKFIF